MESDVHNYDTNDDHDKNSGARKDGAMRNFAEIFQTAESPHPLRKQFLGWQCRVRQIAMREHGGKPDDAIMPLLTIEGDESPLGHIITVINKQELFSKTPELKHIFSRTNDPEQRRQKALQLFSETYYQKSAEFSETICATFQPDSKGAERILQAGKCNLFFEAYQQAFFLRCSVIKPERSNHHFQATWAHNLLFNPHLNPDTVILGFVPNWEESSADSMPVGG